MDNHTTTHRLIFDNAESLSALADQSIALVATSPPYPMIAMWDDIMANQDDRIRKALDNNDGSLAFEMMHQQLDKIWSEIARVTIPGGVVCINIGDATRTIDGNFQLYSNHSRIIKYFLEIGFVNLPNIIWRKQTNAPNKFMGSGMMPPGAYVTLEHEWILVFRKGNKRMFKSEEEKANRKKSAYFWSERNQWFSDLWDFKGTKQKLKSTNRERSAAYPFEVPYRLINMYSVYGDTVLDPFLGTGTTALASIVSGRNSVGVEIDTSFQDVITQNILEADIDVLNELTEYRIKSQIEFIENREKLKGPVKHYNEAMGMKVMTSQESTLSLNYIESIEVKNGVFSAEYSPVKSINQAKPIVPQKNKTQLNIKF